MLLKSKLTSTLQSMALFLANKDTEYILFKPVKVMFLYLTLHCFENNQIPNQISQNYCKKKH